MQFMFGRKLIILKEKKLNKRSEIVSVGNFVIDRSISAEQFPVTR